MNDSNNNNIIKRPIRGTMLTLAICLILFVVLVVSLISIALVHQISHNRNEKDLSSIINYVEERVDADDLLECKKTGVKSQKYIELQDFLNDMVDSFDIDYLYIVDPSSGIMTNIISGTSKEEKENGEPDSELLETTDAYSDKEIKRYNSVWEHEDVVYFEESSDYGEFFTACKVLKSSTGENVALICADIDTASIHITIYRTVAIISITVLAACTAFALALWVLLRKQVIGPIIALEKSVSDYAKESSEDDILNVKYNSPVINTKNEVESLSVAIAKMTEEIKAKANESISAALRADTAEEKLNILEMNAKAMQSVATLLDNMPALSFYKDIETGKYVMCNQAFSNYCHKEKPEDVIGLTDFDIFDEKTARHFVEDDKKAFYSDAPYVFFEDVPDAAGVNRQFQTTKIKFVDPLGKQRILGMGVDVSEVMSARKEREEAKNESLTYARIASALSLDYVYLYYIDIENDKFIEYRSASLQENLALERRGSDFFNASHQDALSQIYKEDLPLFLSKFTKENVLDNINRYGLFTITYRLLIQDKPVYVNMKASKFNDDDKHIIIGVSNVDAQMKEQEALKRIHEEQITYERINALSDDYICIYTIDPETEDYIEYSATKDFETLGLAKSGKNFFSQSRKEGARTLYPDDIEKFNDVMYKENIINRIKENGLFVFNYRLIINNTPTYVSLKANIIEEQDGPQLIIGVSNIDAQVKREQEYESNLTVARMQADIDALTGVKNKHAYIDLEAQLNEQIDKGEKVAFAVVICDINGLKLINDNKGHTSGDEYIRSACKVICDIFKHSPVFRIGGDEFAVIAQGEDYQNVEQLTKQVKECNVLNDISHETILACGFAKYSKDKNVSSVFSRADTEMYKNKHEIKSAE